jgi:hypothetical protein
MYCMYNTVLYLYQTSNHNLYEREPTHNSSIIVYSVNLRLLPLGFEYQHLYHSATIHSALIPTHR